MPFEKVAILLQNLRLSARNYRICHEKSDSWDKITIPLLIRYSKRLALLGSVSIVQCSVSTHGFPPATKSSTLTRTRHSTSRQNNSARRRIHLSQPQERIPRSTRLKAGTHWWYTLGWVCCMDRRSRANPLQNRERPHRFPSLSWIQK
jgi:hypothetical protein